MISGHHREWASDYVYLTVTRFRLALDLSSGLLLGSRLRRGLGGARSAVTWTHELLLEASPSVGGGARVAHAGELGELLIVDLIWHQHPDIELVDVVVH